jgi:hypothetical protein
MNIFKYFIGKLKKKIRDYNINVFPNFYRPTSRPFISGDTFRKTANFIFDETQGFDPSLVKRNDIIFLKTDLIEIYFKYFHSKIDEKYILITHNSDCLLEEKYKILKDKNIIHWFSQNLSFSSSEDFSSLPIGLENKRYQKNGVINHFLKYKNTPKEKYILSSFNKKTNPSRSELISKLENNNLITSINLSSHKEYTKYMSLFKFNLCPEGNGTDTHRFWESLMLNTFPIVQRGPMINNFEKLGIPALYLDSWDEIKTFDAHALDVIYQNLLSYDYSEFLSLHFWESKINQKKI